MTAAERRAAAAAAAPKLRAMEGEQANTLRSRAAAARRRIEKGTAVYGDTETAAADDGMSAGFKVRERTAAAERLDVYSALADHRELTDAERAERAADAELLAEAERRAAAADRPAGRWTRDDSGRMTPDELSRLCQRAAGVERAAWRQRAHAKRESEAARYDAVGDLAAELALIALQRAAGVQARAMFLAPYGTPTADRTYRVMEYNAGRDGLLPAWHGLYPAEGYDRLTLRRAVTPTTRDRWFSWLRLRARDALQAEADRAAAEQAIPEHIAPEGAMTTTPQGRRRAARAERVAQVSSAARATVHDMAEALKDVRPLGRMERDAIEATLHRLSHRERAERDGSTLAASKTRAAKGRAALAKRWPDRAAFDGDMTAAHALADQRDRAAAAAMRVPVGAPMLTLDCSLRRVRRDERAEQARMVVRTAMMRADDYPVPTPVRAPASTAARPVALALAVGTYRPLPAAPSMPNGHEEHPPTLYAPACSLPASYRWTRTVREAQARREAQGARDSQRRASTRVYGMAAEASLYAEAKASGQTREQALVTVHAARAA